LHKHQRIPLHDAAGFPFWSCLLPFELDHYLAIAKLRDWAYYPVSVTVLSTSDVCGNPLEIFALTKRKLD
jgi:hypothetical protein